jgi:hypothetical protein
LVHASHLPGARVTENIEGPLQTARARDALLAVASVASVASVGDQPLAEVLADSRYEPLLLGLARELQAGRGGPLTQRVVELVTAIEQGRRPRAQENLDLLAAHERLERLGRPLNAACAAIGAPDRAHGVHGTRTGPLAGRPVGIKDIIAVAGVPTRCGSPASDPRPAAADAAVVRRLREAGAEVFATTQCLEYAAGFAHPEIGDTRNPRDPSRPAGGSSGG